MSKPRPLEKSSNMPSYMRPLYSFPESGPVQSNLPQIKIQKPWGSALDSYSPETSYANSFTRNRRSTKIKEAANSILGKSFDTSLLASAPIQDSRSKSLMKLGDVVTAQALSNVNRLSPSNLNFAIKIKPEYFEDHDRNAPHHKVSPNNSVWITEKERKNKAEKFHSGEYIPSVTQMDLYGKKEQKSKFEAYELWR